jgi:hypothetical protein
MKNTEILRKLFGDKISEWKERKDGHLAINRRWGTITLRILKDEIVISFMTNEYVKKLLNKSGVNLIICKVSLADPELADKVWEPIATFTKAINEIEKDHGGNRRNRKNIARQNN